MHSFAPHRHSSAGKAPAKETKGLVLNDGWRYDLGEWFHDTFSFHGNWHELRQRTINLARLQPGDAVGELHLWNEHLLLVSVRRRDLRWAVTMRRRATQSLRLLAAHLLSDHRFDDVKALYIQPASVGGRRAANPQPHSRALWLRSERRGQYQGAAIMVIPLWRQFLAVDDGLDVQPRPQSGRLAVRPAARRVLDLSCALHRPIWKQRRK